LKFSAMFLRHFIPCTSADIHRKFYGDEANHSVWEEVAKRKRGREI